MGGYSRTPLERKLGVTPDRAVLLDRAPDDFELDALSARRLLTRFDADRR